MENDTEVLQTSVVCDSNRSFSNDAHLEEATKGTILQQLLFQTEVLEPKVNYNVIEETNFKLKEPPDIEEILSTDKNLIPATSHNVSVINSACQHVLKEMEQKLLILLKKNRNEQEIIQHYIECNGKSPYFENLRKTSLKIAGMPYFKDKQGFIPPPNEDVLRKKANKKLLPVDFIQSFPVWTAVDAVKLIKAVSKCEVMGNSEIDWMKISVTDMDGKYSPGECRAKWIMNLKPDVNISRWTLKENRCLQEIAAKYNYQNWDAIAEELGTGRSGLQCCIQYQTHKCPSEGKWSKEEDENLKELVEKYRVKDFIPWTKVVWHFQHRSLKQCQERYSYHLANIKKGPFTMEEDFVIAYLAPKLKNFGEVAKFLPNRVATQVRARYEYLIELSMPEFTKDEDELLSKLMIQYPKNWGKISEHFKNRSKVQCRRRWGYLQRGIKVKKELESGDEEENFLNPSRDNTRRNKSDADMVKKNLHIISKPERKSKKYPEIYNKLLEHFQDCYKFLFGPRPRNLTYPKELKQLLTKLKITMRNLSVCKSPLTCDFDVNALVSNCEFDKEDISLLESIKSEEGLRHIALSTKVLPPNFITLVGLRTIFMVWSKMNNRSNSSGEPQKSAIDPNDRVLYGDAKKLFKARMKALFAFPLLLSNIPRLENQKPLYKPKSRKNVKPLSKLQRKRHAKYMAEIYRKKMEKCLSEKLSESDAETTEKRPVNSNNGKRKYTRRSRNVEDKGGSGNAIKRRGRSSKTAESEASAAKKLALYKMYSD